MPKLKSDPFDRQLHSQFRWRRKLLIPIAIFLITLGSIGVPAFSQSTPIQSDTQEFVDRSRSLYEAGHFAEATTLLQQAAEAFQSQGDRLGQAIALSNLALAFEKLGQLETASAAITASLTLLDRLDSPLVLAQTLEIRGQLELALGKADKALDSWKEAAKIYDRKGDGDRRIRNQINIAQAQQALGMYRQARTTLEQVNQTLRTQPDSLTKAIALRSLGDVLQLVGDLETSLIALQRSKEITENLQSPLEMGATLLSLGNTQKALGNRSRSTENRTELEKQTPLSCPLTAISGETLRLYQEAAKTYQSIGQIATAPITQVQADINLLSLFIEQKKASVAQELASNIQLKITKIPPSQASIYAQINLAHNLSCLKQNTATTLPSWTEIANHLSMAIQQAKQIGDRRSEAYAIGILAGIYLENRDLVRAQALTQQALLLAQQIEAADIAYLWQWQLGYLLKVKGEIPSAIVAYQEAINSLKSLRTDLVALNPDIQFSFRDRVEPVYRQFVDLLLQPNDRQLQNQTPISQNNLKQARDAIEALQLSELENFFREACLQAKPQEIDEIVDKIDPTAAVIYPIVLSDRLEIILKLPTDSNLHRFTTLTPQIELETKLNRLQQYLREPDRINDVKKISQEVYRWLIQPLTTELEKKPVKTLVFILDGALRNLPMGVLYDGQKQEYLIQKYAIAIAPGLQLIDPQPLQRGKLSALMGGVSEGRQIAGRRFAPLENVKLELQEIQLEIPQSQQLVNETFTETSLQHQISSLPFSVVHLATHGQFSSNADQTFILTWEQLLNVKSFDRLLRLRDRDDAKAIELLVLSACQTAAGDQRATLGLAGMAVRAGARSTLATLWSVDDESTAKLMSQFYQQLVNAKVTKAEALRRAQLALLTEYDTPYFWASYVLIGNWL